jgi:hypothetical protein
MRRHIGGGTPPVGFVEELRDFCIILLTEVFVPIADGVKLFRTDGANDLIRYVGELVAGMGGAYRNGHGNPPRLALAKRFHGGAHG